MPPPGRRILLGAGGAGGAGAAASYRCSRGSDCRNLCSFPLMWSIGLVNWEGVGEGGSILRRKESGSAFGGDGSSRFRKLSQ